jgi:hypothetical protein
MNALGPVIHEAFHKMLEIVSRQTSSQTHISFSVFSMGVLAPADPELCIMEFELVTNAMATYILRSLDLLGGAGDFGLMSLVEKTSMIGSIDFTCSLQECR